MKRIRENPDHIIMASKHIYFKAVQKKPPRSNRRTNKYIHFSFHHKVMLSKNLQQRITHRITYTMNIKFNPPSAQENITFRENITILVIFSSSPKSFWYFPFHHKRQIYFIVNFAFNLHPYLIYTFSLTFASISYHVSTL